MRKNSKILLRVFGVLALSASSAAVCSELDERSSGVLLVGMNSSGKAILDYSFSPLTNMNRNGIRHISEELSRKEQSVLILGIHGSGLRGIHGSGLRDADESDTQGIHGSGLR